MYTCKLSQAETTKGHSYQKVQTHTHSNYGNISFTQHTHTSASARTQLHWLSSLGKETGFQQRSERLNGVLLLDTLGEDIPEGGSDIPEGLLAIPLCLGIPGPGKLKERSRNITIILITVMTPFLQTPCSREEWAQSALQFPHTQWHTHKPKIRISYKV